MLVRVEDRIGRVAADSVLFVTPPLPRVTCSIDNNVLICDSNNPIATQLCQFDIASSIPCTSPLDLIELGLALGPHSLSITLTDIFDRTLVIPVEFTIRSNLELTCSEAENEREYVGGIDCTSSGGLGDVNYTCSYDGRAPEDCELLNTLAKQCCRWCIHFTGAGTFPIVLNFFEFSSGDHDVTVVARDSVGTMRTYMYFFTGMTPTGTSTG